MLEVKLEVADREPKYTDALVDSGVGATIVPLDIALWAGASWDTMPDAETGSGIAGHTPLKLLQGLTVTSPVFPDIEIAKVVRVAKDLPYVLLGRQDFFLRFVVEFHWTVSQQGFFLEPQTST